MLLRKAAPRLRAASIISVLLLVGAAVPAAGAAQTATAGASNIYVGGLGVSVIDEGAGAVSSTIAMHDGTGILGQVVQSAASADGSVLYILTDGVPSGTETSVLTEYDNTSHAIIKKLDLTQQGLSFILSPDSHTAYVAGMVGISVVDLTTMTQSAMITTSNGTEGEAVSPDGSRLYASANSGIEVYNTATFAITHTIKLGVLPRNVVLSPDGSTLYVTSIKRVLVGTKKTDMASVAVISTATSKVTDTVVLGKDRGRMIAGISPNGADLYLSAGGTILLFDTATNAVTSTIKLPNGGTSFSSSVFFSADGSQTFVLFSGVQVINTATGKLVRTIASGDATSFALSPDGSRVYLTAVAGADTVSVVDTDTGAVTATIPVPAGSATTGAVIAGGGSELLVDSQNFGTVSVIDTSADTVTTTIDNAFGNASVIAVSPDGTTAVVEGYANTVRALDLATGTLGGTADLDGPAMGIAYAPDGAQVYVATASSAYVIDTATMAITATIPIGAPDTDSQIAVSPDGSRVYVLNENVGVSTSSGTVSAIDTATDAVTTIPLPTSIAGGGAIAVSPDGTQVLVGYQSAETGYPAILAAVNTATDAITVVDSGSIGVSGIAFSPDGSRFYTLGPAAGTVSVFDSATDAITATISVGAQVRSIAVTPDGSFVYVANQLAGTVSAIDTATDTVSATIPITGYANALAIGPA